MKPISTTEKPLLTFTQEIPSHPFNASGNKIGWLTAKANKPGAKYDIIIKDAHGRIKHQMLNCGHKETDQYGEMINIETQIGEQLEVTVENIKGAESVDLFIN